MRIYAERPGRVLLQLLADAGALAWVYFVVQFARAARDVVLQLQGPARRLVGAGDAIRGAFDSAAATAAGVPFVGDDLARALGTGSTAGDSLSSSGREIAATATTAGTAVLAAVVLLGVVPVVAVWLTLRVRWVRAASSARDRAGRGSRPARAAGPHPPPDPAAARGDVRARRGLARRRPGGGRRAGRGGAGRARAALRRCQEATVTRRESVMAGRPAPSDGSSSVTRIS